MKKTCPNCGRSFDEDVEFCFFCGPSYRLDGSTGGVVKEPVKKEKPKKEKPAKKKKQEDAAEDDIFSNDNVTVDVGEAGSVFDDTEEMPKKKASGWLVALLIILGIVLVAAIGVGAFLFLRSKSGKDSGTTASTNTSVVNPGGNTSNAGNTSGSSGASAQPTLSQSEIDDIFSRINTANGLLNESKQLIEQDEDYLTGMQKMGEIMDTYLEIATTYGALETVRDPLKEAYAYMCASGQTYVQSLVDAPVGAESADCYQQIRDCLIMVENSGQQLVAAGYTESEVQNNMDAFTVFSENCIDTFRANVIEGFDATAKNDKNYSRSEGWKIMKGMNECGIYETDDLDDPIRLRYVYAKALHIDSKFRDVSGVAGFSDEDEYASNATALLEETDYNPVLLESLSEIMGGDYTIAYLEFCRIVNSGSRYSLQEDRGSARGYWYWNDLNSSYCFDGSNGSDASMRDSIRSTMKSILGN